MPPRAAGPANPAPIGSTIRRLDPGRLATFSDPLTLTIHRLKRDPASARALPSEVIAPPSGEWTKDRINKGLHQEIVAHAGGGTYHVQVMDASGNTDEGYFSAPGKEVTPPEMAMAVAQAEAQARATQQQVAAVMSGVMSPPPPSYASPYPPYTQQQQQPFGPYGQPPFGAQPPSIPVPAPFGPYGQTLPWQQPWQQTPWQSPWGQPPQPFSPYYQSPPYLPPQVPPAPNNNGGVSPALEAEMAQLKLQNAQMREDAIRREQRAEIDRLALEMRTYMQQSEARFNALVEKLTHGRPDQDLQLKLAQIDRDRQADFARMEAQHAQERLRLEMARIEDQRRSSEDQLRSQLAQATQNQNQAQMQFYVQQLTQVQQQASTAQREVLERAAAQQPGMLEMLKLYKDLQGNDPFAAKLKDLALEMFANPQGGAPSTAQVVGNLGQQLIQGAQSIAGSVIDAQQKQAIMKVQAEAAAKQRLAQMRAQQQAEASRQAAAALGVSGSNGVAHAGSNGAVAATAPPPTLGDAGAPEAPVIPIDAAESLAAEEKPYFAQAYDALQQLRKLVATSQLSPEAIIEAFIQSYLYFRNLGLEGTIPAMTDMIKNSDRFIRTALPDIATALKAELAQALPMALQEALAEVAAEEKAAEA